MLHFSLMTEAELDAVAAAEARIYDFPWTRGNFADSLAAGYGAWLAEEGGRMAGYAVGFFFFWAIATLSSALTLYLVRTAHGEST